MTPIPDSILNSVSDLGKYSEALDMYTALLSLSPANIPVMKRKVSLYKAKGDQANVITELNAILKVFPSEASCWLELGEIYLSICSYDDAVHCFEELVLLDPNSFANQLKLAEVYYTLGKAFYGLSKGVLFIGYDGCRWFGELLECSQALCDVAQSSVSEIQSSQCLWSDCCLQGY